MKTAFALAFLAVICGAYATSLSEIDRSAFGKNLLDTVYLEMKTGDNAQTVLELLAQVATEIENEQHDHDTRHADFQVSCSADLEYYAHEIQTATEDIATAEGRLARDRPALESAQGHLQDLSEAKRRSEDALRVITELIVAQREEFHGHESELLAALQIFAAARDILRTSFNVEGAFLQTSVGSALAAHLSKAKITGKYEPFVRILAQAASSGKLTAQGVQDVLTIIDRLAANTDETLTSEREVMAQREHSFATYSTELEGIINNLANEIAQVTSLISTLSADIAEWERNLEDAQFRLQSNQEHWNTRKAECDNENETYATETQKRTEDLDIVHQVEALISTRVADFTQYINQSRENVHID
jgi:Skp family chaperone for outer membrane proteins